MISKSQLRTGKLYLHNIKIINKFRRTISYLHFDLGGDVTCKINTALENFTSKILTWLFKSSKYMYIPCGFFFCETVTRYRYDTPPPPYPPTHQYFNKSFFDRDRKTNNSHYYKQHIESMVLLAEKMKKKRLDI